MSCGRFEHEDRWDYDLERFDQEFKERLYSERGKEIMAKHEVNPLTGGVNDREWHEVGRARTYRAAIDKARDNAGCPTWEKKEAERA